VARAGTLVAGVVGWAELTAPDVADQVARLLALPGGDRLAGVRPLVQDVPDRTGWTGRTAAAGCASSASWDWSMTCWSARRSCPRRSAWPATCRR
jgi:hypothetical protein